MKKLIINTAIIFTISTFITYTLLTFFRLHSYCEKYQIKLFVTEKIDTDNLDEFKLKAQGEHIEKQKDLIKTDSNLSKYNLTGYAFWLQMQSFIGDVFSYYMYSSLLLGISISVGYLSLNISKIKTLFKILIGYILPIIILPIIYMWIFKATFNPFMTTTDRNANILLFVISYTVIFSILFIIYKTKRKVITND